MSDKPKKWTWEEWELERKLLLEEVGADPSKYWNKTSSFTAFEANEPLIDWQEKRIAELEKQYEPDRNDIDSYVKYLSVKFHQEVEHLTRDQFEVALKQAIESGDFVRATMPEYSPLSARQGIYYIPYNLKTDLSKAHETIAKLREALKHYDTEPWRTKNGSCFDTGEVARTALKECFGEES